MTPTIPKNLHHIWIGGVFKPPTEWMNTWPEKHPEWQYKVWTSLEDFPFKNYHIMQSYYSMGRFAGAADLMRYEILYNFGGFIPPSDAICLNNVEELFDKEGCYTVYEHEIYKPGLVSPIYACPPGNKFVGAIIDRLGKLDPTNLDTPWKATGNGFLKNLIEELQPIDLTIFPSHFFIPNHYSGYTYKGTGKIYADQMWGTTKNRYERV